MLTLYVCYFSAMTFCLIIWLLYYKKIATPLLIFGIFLGINLPLELCGLYLTLNQKGSFIIYHFQNPWEFLCISLYFRLLYDSKLTRLIFTIVIVVCMILFAFLSAYIQKIPHNNSYTVLIYHAVLIAITLFTITSSFFSSKLSSTGLFSVFWVCTACLAYYPANILISAFIGEIYNRSHETAGILWNCILVVHALFYIFLSFSFISSAKKSQYVYKIA